jgi:2-polyprenyl-6-methoxyphenol hydroxylase-like FAD-dependent oxidoreductase
MVIGGGIAGPVTALALRRAGIEATVYEAYEGNADGVGGTMAIAPNGLDALDAVGAGELVAGLGQPITRTRVTDGAGRPIMGFDHLADLPPSRALWRDRLYRALHDHAAARGVPIVPGKRLVATAEDDGAVTATFADGGTARADILVGADGIHSTVRGLIDPAAPGPDRVPLLNLCGLSEYAPPNAHPTTTYFAFGRRGFLGYWVQPDGRTAWFANVPFADPVLAEKLRATTSGEWLTRLRGIYADDVPGRELMARGDPATVACLGWVDIMPRVPHWSRGRMVLVGDSVHAPSPSSGQGASLAAESGVQLARCLRDLPDVPAAFAAYEGMRRGRVEKVAARASKTNNSKTVGPAAITMMRLVMPLMSRLFMTPEKTIGFEHRHRIDFDAPVEAPALARAAR